MKKLFITAAFALTAANVFAAGHIGFCYPAGAQRGQTVDIVLGGQGIGGKRQIDAGPGIEIEKITYVPGFPVPVGDQRRYMQRWIEALEHNKPRPVMPENTQFWRVTPWYDNLDKLNELETAIFQRWFFTPRNPLQMSPSINQRVILKLKIDKNAPTGKRELRLKSYSDVTNPVPFFVSDAPEIKEPLYRRPGRKEVVPTPYIPVPGTANGQIYPGECDKFLFKAKKGEVITFTTTARELVPFIGDGVPGHFQAVLEVFNANGRSVAFADDHHFNPDPLMVFKAPADGVYTLAIRDAIYRGRADFVYRISAVRGAPKFVMPPAPARISDLVLFDGRNGSVTPPARLQGVISKPQEKFSFILNASPEKPVVLELFARRMGSPLDGIINIYDQDNKLIASNDDIKRPRVGLTLHNADSYLLFKAPKKGGYRVEIADTTGAGSAEHYYHLRIDFPRPGFIGYITPSLLSVPRNGCKQFTAIVERLDGFDKEIKLELRNSHGCKLIGENTIPAKSERATFTLQAPKKAINKLVNIEVFARNGREIINFCAGDELMQAFAYYHVVPSKKLYVAPSWSWNAHLFAWSDLKKVSIKKGSSATFKIKVGNLPQTENPTIDSVEPIDPPTGVTVSDMTFVDGTLSFKYNVSKDCAAFERNQLFLVRVSYDRKPDRRGIIKKAKNAITLPVRRISVR